MCLFRCKIKWEDKTVEENWNRYFFLNNQTIPFIKETQHGKCEKCGKIYKRYVSYP